MQTVEMKSPTLTDANAALRHAVEERLSGGCCDGARCTPKGPQASIAEQTLQAALDAVKDRHTKYGPPVAHFTRTAALVNAAFGTTFTASDWALVMVPDKVARQLGPEATDDSPIDIAGYAACHQECRRG